MITQKGYSKDQSILPEGIAVTLPKQFFEDRQMAPVFFERYFVRVMSDEETVWNFKLTNLPKFNVLYVYFVFEGFIRYRLNLVMYERNTSKTFNDTPDGKVRDFEKCNWVICAGPAVKAPFDYPQKGFQGFRYTTYLF